MNKQTILRASHIVIRSGCGGNGKVSFRRERFVPKGGPDGGNGGNGGSVILKADKTIDYLEIFKNRRHFYAENGHNGQGKMQYGKKGQDLYINLPLGTEVYDEDNQLIIDLINDGMEYIIAYGGKGGVGNMHLANSIDKAPRHTIPATPGEEKILSFKLKIIADIGLVGFPNAGKSSIINCLTNTNSLVGSYPFTTLTAHLGVLSKNNKSMTIVDIPGIVENASQGKGMGLEFLQNVERCHTLAIVLDGSLDYQYQYYHLIQELNMYNTEILKKKIIIIINKSDMLKEEKKKSILLNWNYPVILVSVIDDNSINQLKNMLWDLYNQMDSHILDNHSQNNNII
jgi:GTP-binding protein